MQHHIILWIGGAADKYQMLAFGPTKIMHTTMTRFDLPGTFKGHNNVNVVQIYLGANGGVPPTEMIDFKAAINAPAVNIPSAKEGDERFVHIIAHSWGARLAYVVCERIKVERLITLDPVGAVSFKKIPMPERPWFLGGGKIPDRQIPQYPGSGIGAPRCEYWHNIDAEKKEDRDFSDTVASTGGDWMSKPADVILPKDVFEQRFAHDKHVLKNYRIVGGEHETVEAHHGWATTMLQKSGAIKELIDHIKKLASAS